MRTQCRKSTTLFVTEMSTQTDLKSSRGNTIVTISTKMPRKHRILKSSIGLSMIAGGQEPRKMLGGGFPSGSFSINTSKSHANPLLSLTTNTLKSFVCVTQQQR